MTRPREIDPELLQAVVDLHPRYAEYARFKAQKRSLKSPFQFRNRAAAHEAMMAAWADIRLRAERIAVKPAVLGALLRVQAEEIGRIRRRPNKTQMEKAIRTAIDDCREGCRAARLAVEKAEKELAQAEFSQSALRTAYAAYTGYSA